MRKFLISAILLSAAATAAAPASAQSWGNRGFGYNQGRNIEQQLAQLADRIRRAEDRDLISEREEDRLLRRVAGIDRRYDNFRRNGLNQWEYNDLQQRIQTLRQQLRFERREGRWDDRRDDWDDRRDRRRDRYDD